MQCLEVSGAVRLIYRSLGVKGLIILPGGPRLEYPCPNVFENLQAVILGFKPTSWRNITEVCNGNCNMSIRVLFLDHNTDLQNKWNSTSSLTNTNPMCENY